jgi:hypothetical protein
MVYLGDRILEHFGEQDFVAEKEARRKRDEVIAQVYYLFIVSID